MAKLDRFLTALTEYKAEALILEQDNLPSFRFLSGTKPVSKQVVDAAGVLSLVAELSGRAAIDSFREDGALSFTYQHNGTSYTGLLEEDAGRVVATLWETSREVAAHAPPQGSRAVHVRAEAPPPKESPSSAAPHAAPASPDAPAPGSSAFARPAPASGPVELPDSGASKAATPASQPAAVSGAVSVGALDALEADSDGGPMLQLNLEEHEIPNDLPSHFREQMDALLRLMVERRASDLHLTSGSPPILRVDGQMQTIKETRTQQPEALFKMLFSITPRHNRDQYLLARDTDFAYAIDGLSRFRVNLFHDRMGPGGVFRAIPNQIMTADELGLPNVVRELAKLRKGLVLVTGPTGSGKSTTLAAMLDLVNSQREDHVITVEDPIEFVHRNKKCLINQREVGVHTSTFKSALRAALREDPDVVLVGEMRDLETISIAVETAVTGHLVFATLHTTTAASSVDRLIDQFPHEQQDQVRVMLADALRAVISQTLLRRKGGGRVPAMEILLCTPAISNLIREGKTFQIEGTMQTGKNVGMQTMNDHLLELVRTGKVDVMEAYVHAIDKQAFKDVLARAGIALKQ